MKNRVIIPLLILVIIILGSVAIAQYQDKKATALPYTIGSPVAKASDMPAGMVMKTYTMPTTAPDPTIAMTINKDSMDGWDVHVTTTNFIFSPEHLDGDPVAGEGHVHLYIDDHLIIMLGDWYHIDALTPGTHVIRVGLFNNDHSAYTMAGMPDMKIEASQTINVK